MKFRFKQEKITVLTGKPEILATFIDKVLLDKDTFLSFCPEIGLHYTEFGNKCKTIINSKSKMLIITQSKEFLITLTNLAQASDFVLYKILPRGEILKYDKDMLIYAFRENIEIR